MKQVSAVLLILAVLNPLCCCFAFGNHHQVDVAKVADHACCNSESDSQGSSNQDQHAGNCEHEVLKDTLITANTDISLPDLQLASLHKLNSEPYDFNYLRSSLASLEKKIDAKQSVPRWVGIQTDCVRRL